MNFDQIMQLERQYELEHRVLRTEHMNVDQSQRAHDGRVAATKRAHDKLMTALDAMSTDELKAYGEYRKSVSI